MKAYIQRSLKLFMIGVLILTVCFSGIHKDNADVYSIDVINAATKKPFQLSDTQYKKVKGWWTQNSSGGWDVKFSRSKVKYYDRETGKISWTADIRKCKKQGKIYVYYIQSGNRKYEYRTETSGLLECYSSWDDKNIVQYYSGSSSLSRGKWN